MYHLRFNHALSIVLVVVLLMTTRSSFGYFNSGSSRELVRFPFSASNISASFGVFQDETFVLPISSTARKLIYSFHTNSELRGHYTTWAFDDVWASTDILYAGCLDPINKYLYLIRNHMDIYRVSHDNLVELLYSFDVPVSEYSFFCVSTSNLLVVVTDDGFLYVNASSNTTQLRKPNLLLINSVLAAEIVRDRLVVALPSFFSMPSESLTVFSFALNDSFSLVESLTIPLENNTQLLACAIATSSAESSPQVAFLLLDASLNDSSTLQMLIMDALNLSVFYIQKSNFSNPWSDVDAHNLLCVNYVDENVALVTLLPPNMDSHFVRVNTTTMAMEAYEFPSLLRGLKLGFSSAQRFRTVACEMDADVEICRLFQYQITLSDDKCEANLRDTINVATQPYDIQAISSYTSDDDAVFALSMRQSALRAYTTPSERPEHIYFELLKLNMSDFCKPKLQSSVTFQVPLCRAVDSSLTTNLELELDGSLLFQVNCRSMFFDTRSLRLLSAPVITVSNCTAQLPQSAPSTTDRNGTQYHIWRDGSPTVDLFAQEIDYRTGSCSEIVDLGLLPPQVVLSNTAMEILITSEEDSIRKTIGIVSPFYYASFAVSDNDEWNLTYVWMNETLSQSIDAYLTAPIQHHQMIYYLNVAFGSNNRNDEITYDIYFSSINSESNQFDSLLLYWFSLAQPPQSITLFSVTNSALQVLFDSGLLVTATLPSGEIVDSIQLSPSSGPYLSAIASSPSAGGDTIAGGVFLVAGANLYLVYSNCAIGLYRNVSSGECLPCPANSISSLEDQQLCLSCPPRTTVNSELNACLCSPNYYSANNDTNCSDCPAGAICIGNNTVIAQNGYWRGANNSFYSCPFAEGCASNGCAPGYRGAVCGVCASGYGRTPVGCAVCPKVPWHYSVPILTASFLVLLLILILLWRDNEGDNEQFFGVVKTLLSFAQVLSFPSGRVPYFANRPMELVFSRIVSFVSTIGLRVFSAASLDCLFGRDVSSFYVELISIGFVPLAIGLLILVWCQLCRSPLELDAENTAVVSLPRKELRYSAEDTTLSINRSDSQLLDQRPTRITDTKLGAPIRLLLFIFLLLYPYVSTMIVQFFDCQQVEGRYYLVADYSSVCFSGTWRRMLPYETTLAILYPICGPVAVFLLLKYKRHLVNVSFLTARYKAKYYYWDVVEMLRKFILLCSLVWDQYEQQRNPAGWFSGLPLLVASLGLLLHVHLRPHSARLNYYLHALSLFGVCLLYALPAITPTDHRNLYRIVASYVVIIYIAGFTALSSLIAVYVARHQLWKLVVSVAGVCCCCRKRICERGERRPLLKTV